VAAWWLRRGWNLCWSWTMDWARLVGWYFLNGMVVSGAAWSGFCVSEEWRKLAAPPTRHCDRAGREASRGIADIEAFLSATTTNRPMDRSTRPRSASARRGGRRVDARIEERSGE